MGTNATIIKEETNGRYRSIYLHFDGYLSHAGKILANHYSHEDAVDNLLNLGNLSELNKTLETSVAYGRDRKERNQEAQLVKSLRQINRAFYTYLWKDGIWYISKGGDVYENLKEQLLN
jgi:hypothetical protein